MDSGGEQQERAWISPAQVRGQTFRSALFGYSKDDVESFLDELAESYGRVHEEKTLLEDRLRSLDDVVAEYRKLERTLQETLIRAEQAADQTLAAARERAQAVMEEARVEAKRLVNQAMQEVVRIDQEIVELDRRRAGLVAQIIAICRGELALLRNLAGARDVKGPGPAGGRSPAVLDAQDEEEISEGD